MRTLFLKLIVLLLMLAACEAEEANTRSVLQSSLNATSNGPLVTPIDSPEDDKTNRTRAEVEAEWDVLLNQFEDNLNSYVSFQSSYQLSEVLAANAETAEILFREVNSLVRAGNLTLENAKDETPTGMRIDDLKETVEALDQNFTEQKRRLLALQKLEVPLTQTVTVQNSTFPLRECEGKDSCTNASNNEFWGNPSGGEPPLLVLRGLSPGLLIKLTVVSGSTLFELGQVQLSDCADGFTDQWNTYPARIPVLQLTDEVSGLVMDPKITTPNDSFAIPVNEPLLVEGNFAVPEKAVNAVISIPDDSYSDNSGSCTIEIEVIL